MISTDTHTYFILPADRWSLAQPLMDATFGTETAAQLPSPAVAQLLVAQNNATGELEGFMFLQLLAHSEPFGCTAGVGVSFSKFHELVRAVLPPGSVYHSHIPVKPEAVAEAQEARLVPLSNADDLRTWVGVGEGDVGWTQQP